MNRYSCFFVILYKKEKVLRCYNHQLYPKKKQKKKKVLKNIFFLFYSDSMGKVDENNTLTPSLFYTK